MGKIIILNYGEILSDHINSNSDRGISEQLFLSQLSLIKSLGIPVVLHSEWALQQEENKLAVALNFYGNSISHHATVLPILTEQGIKATFFPVVSGIDQQKQLTWTQLSSLIENGHEVGSGGMSGKRLCHLRKSNIQLELELSKRLLNKNLNQTTTILAPILGKCSRRVLQAAFNAGYLNVIANSKKVNPSLPQFFMKGLNMQSKRAVSNFEYLVVNGLLSSDRHLPFSLLSQRFSKSFGIGFMQKAGETMLKAIER